MIEALTPWEPSLLVPGCLLTVIALYLGRKTHEGWLKQLSFWTGLAAFYAASFTHLDYLAEHQFFVHRLQHALLHHVGPFFIVISRPGRALWSAIPDYVQTRLERICNWRPLAKPISFLNHPFIAVISFCGLIAFWLVPSVHFLAMIDVRLYKMMNWSMVINGLMFWSLVLNNVSIRPATLSPGTRLAMMLAIVPPQVLIGAILVFTPFDLYPVYAACGRLSLDPIGDQQIGGAILWLSGMMTGVCGIVFIFAKEGFDKTFQHRESR